MSVSLKNILKNICVDHYPLELQSLAGSSKALVLALLSQTQQQSAEKGRPLIIVCESFDVAEVLLNDLYYFCGKKGVHFFPFWDVLPYDNFSPHKGLVAQRFQTLDALLSGELKILVTTPNGLMQRFMPQTTFQKNTTSLSRESVCSTEEIRQKLLYAGYSQVDVVEDQGEFSTHGGILDVFPLNLEKPVRMEFSDKNELLYLKPFDIQSQRTVEPELSALKILPGSEIIFNPETIHYARQTLPDYRKDCSPEVLARLNESLRKSESFPGIESLAPLYYPRLNTLFDYLPEEYLLVINEEKNVEQRAEHFYQEVFMEYELSLQQNKLSLSPEVLFLTHRELGTTLNKSAQVFLNSKSNQKQTKGQAHQFHFADNLALRQGFENSKATSAVGHMIQLLQNWHRDGVPILLSAKNQTHADNFQQLLEDLGLETKVAGSQLTPESCPWLEWMENRSVVSSSPIPILSGNISAGFRKLDAAGQIRFILLTEEEVFGEKTRSRRLQRTQIQQAAGSLDDLREGDHVVHLDYGIGRYQGLQKISAGGSQNEFMQLIYARDEKVYVPVGKFHLVQKYVNADGTAPKLSKLGEKAWKKTRRKVASAVEDIAEELAEIYAQRKASKGFAFAADDHEMQEFELRFPFEETPDQLEVISSVKEDMESKMPMDRLVCGDVGFGKTEIAMRAAFKAVQEEKQVVILVPTTILAQQHYETFSKRFEDTPFIIEVISRFRSATEQKEILKRLSAGKIDIIIGTHRLLSADVKFKDLGLLVVDEEQRFGVKHKEKIKRFRAAVDVLTLSATPIPRTLHMSMMGIRDLSLVNTPPADRRAVRTRLLPVNNYIIQEAVSREIRRGGQVFVVHNRVESIYEYGQFLKTILPNISIAIGHGQMREQELEKVMLDFIEGRFDLLLSTTIIESGLDIPKANTIIIDNAQNFGLSQLYQLRGRVGRSNVQAYAYLLVPAERILSGIAHERLQVLQDLNDLGAGFKVASRDLEIRGAGNLLGSEQSGQIASVGLELYTQMVERAVKKLLQTESGLLPEDIQLRLDHIEQAIPESYIRSTSQRLSLYKSVGTLPTRESLWDFRNGVENRFGMLPESVLNIFRNAEVRLWGQLHGVEKIEHDRSRLRIQVKDAAKLNHEKLIEWLCEQNTDLSYIPENTLDLKNIPAEMPSILNGLKQLEKVFTVSN
ncbi:MAG: transcription-repair coupling factor [SAR324 cluster bacterium]|nr:transcription-repair coupling factor [SAR324 cluster bacterium]MBL7035577.1 transcription-repair coupling factor [SAR324 cluster bacterium]